MIDVDEPGNSNEFRNASLKKKIHDRSLPKKSEVKLPPYVEEFEEKFIGKFVNLTDEETKGIVGIVLFGVEEAKGFNLEIDKELAEKETNFYLASVDNLGGVEGIFKENEFDDVSRKIAEDSAEEFDKERRYFFEKFKSATDSGSANRYIVHLEATRSNILLAIYNGQLENWQEFLTP